jgi:hypothetical protein
MSCEENAQRNSSTDVGINPLILFGYVVVKLALGRTMMAQRGVQVYLYSFFNLGVRCHAPAALTPGRKRGTHRVGGWVGPRAGLDGSGKSHPYRSWV